MSRRDSDLAVLAADSAARARVAQAGETVDESEMSSRVSQQETAAAPERPPVVLRYMVDRNFRQFINSVTINWQKGQVIDREDHLRVLLEQGAPISPIRDESDVGTCPHCGKSFSLESQRGARELLARARQLMPGMV